jgi:hypothetical protein
MSFKSREQQKAAYAKKRAKAVSKRTVPLSSVPSPEKGWRADFGDHGSSQHARTLAASLAADLDTWLHVYELRKGVEDNGKLVSELRKMKTEAARLHQRLEDFTRRIEKAAYANIGRHAPGEYRKVTWDDEGELRDESVEDDA